MVVKTRCIEKSINARNMSCATAAITGVHHIISHHIIYLLEICLGNDNVLLGFKTVSKEADRNIQFFVYAHGRVSMKKLGGFVFCHEFNIEYFGVMRGGRHIKHYRRGCIFHNLHWFGNHL